ncbi:metalloendopeptidase-like membrane protein [Chamaesiphon minutus PCC 6605]|uniref:Metalloendopeptidase-like membrane protein n=2 Tax=Chamaesiphon TaxID=217161 RepID=K9UJY3_CHAP6|nr:metalloendopeptidase-like membrane protein [Chamaesiphon minutus PCC 6605]
MIAGTFLGADTTLARNSDSTVQDLVTNNTLKTQLLGTNRIDNPNPADILAPQTEQDISKNTEANSFSSDRVNAVATAAGATSSTTASQSQAADLAIDDDTSEAAAKHFAQREASGTQQKSTSVFASDVSNLGQHNWISSVPTDAPIEASVVIPVPPPRTQIIKVQPVTRLPRVIKSNYIPSVSKIPTIRPTSTQTTFYPPTAYVNNGETEAPTELIYPLMNPARTTSRFGWRTHPLTGTRRFHSGIDIGAPSGTPVVATATGTVVSAGWNGGYGKAIVIQHNDTLQTLYGHLSEIAVQPGQQIIQGTVIGLVGSTGNSTGPHLHFETRTPGANGWVAVDPTQDIQYAIDNLRRSMPYAGKDTRQGL